MTLKFAAPMLSMILLAPAPAFAQSSRAPQPLAAARLGNPEDQAINAVYGELVRARAASDVAAMVAAFPADAILIGSGPNPPMGGGAELDAQLRPSVAKLAAENVKVETQYRIERRSVRGNIAVDAGYMRMQMTKPDGQGGTRYARFLVTLARNGEGGWQIIGDASMPSDEAAWQRLPKIAGLRRDG